VRQALGVKAGDTIRYVFSEDSVQVLRTRSISEVAGMHARDDLAPVSFDTMETAIADPPICGTKLSQLVDQLQGDSPVFYTGNVRT